MHKAICRIAVGDTEAEIDGGLANDGVDRDEFVTSVAISWELEGAN